MKINDFVKLEYLLKKNGIVKKSEWRRGTNNWKILDNTILLSKTSIENIIKNNKQSFFKENSFVTFDYLKEWFQTSGSRIRECVIYEGTLEDIFLMRNSKKVKFTKAALYMYVDEMFWIGEYTKVIRQLIFHGFENILFKDFDKFYNGKMKALFSPMENKVILKEYIELLRPTISEKDKMLFWNFIKPNLIDTTYIVEEEKIINNSERFLSLIDFSFKQFEKWIEDTKENNSGIGFSRIGNKYLLYLEKNDFYLNNNIFIGDTKEDCIKKLANSKKNIYFKKDFNHIKIELEDDFKSLLIENFLLENIEKIKEIELV